MAEASSSAGRRTIVVPETAHSTSVLEPYNYHARADADPVICIDSVERLVFLPPASTRKLTSGSHSWRAGFSGMPAPYVDGPAIVSRYRERKLNKALMLFGRDVEVDANSRSNARPLYDGDLLINGDMLECALDYTFLKLGIDTGSITHPVVMTEKLANPLFTRAMTSELLFEMYGAPSVAYGIDSLFAFSRQAHQDGLAISLGHQSTTIIPVVDGRGILSRAKRIPWGGAQASDILLRLAQLKYPSFPVKVTPAQATFMFRETAYFASDYEAELRELGDPAMLAAATVVVQFPYTQTESVEKTEEELAAAAERRKESGRRLQEMQSRQRAEKLAAKVAELDEYRALLAERASLRKADFQRRVADRTPFENEAELEGWVKRTEAEVRRKQRKAAGEDEPPEEDPTFPLADRPDDELTEDEVKEKRRQRLMRAGWEARVKLREDKRREQERVDEEKRKEEDERINDPAGWSARLKAEQEAVMTRMEERKKRKAQMGDRKSAAAQNRMKSIANLAADSPAAKKRKKGEDDDGFGRDDSDWAVYREIGGDDDSEAEEDDAAALQSIEARLLQHDPGFSDADTAAGRAHARHALVNAFVRGGTGGRFDAGDTAQAYQLHLNVERARVPEAWFQPAMFGVDAAGVGELAGWLLNGYDDDLRRRMMQRLTVQCVLVTGGGAAVPNTATRVRAALTPVLPFRAPLKVVVPADPRLEAWRGMAQWSATAEARQALVTRQEYDECGQEWIKEHRWGNVPP